MVGIVLVGVDVSVGTLVTVTVLVLVDGSGTAVVADRDIGQVETIANRRIHGTREFAE